MSRSSPPSRPGREPLPDPTDLLTVPEAARRTRIGRSTLYRLIKEGKVSATTGPGPIRLHVAVVRALLPKAPQ